MLLTVVAVPALGQDLTAFLESARQRSVEARLSTEVRVRADADRGQAWGALLPTLTASAGYTYNQYPTVLTFTTPETTITPTDQLEATLRAELPLIDAARWLKAAATASSAVAAADRVSSSWATVQRQVAADYYGHLSARAVLESARRSLSLAQTQVEQTRARTAAGVANELDLVRAQAEVQRNEQLVADAERLLATSGRSLRTDSGLEPGSGGALPDDDLHPEAPLAELETRLEDQPAVRAADHDATAASRTVTAASLALLPTVNAQFTQRFTNAAGFNGKSAYFNTGLTLNWRLDVPSLQVLTAQRSQAATASLNAERARDAARDQLHADWQTVRAALTKVRAASGQVTSARRASALAHERHEAGVATQTDTIQADRDLFLAEMSDIQARAELALARTTLRLSAGEALP